MIKSGPEVVAALKAVGERLGQQHPDLPTVSVYLVGGVAGMLTEQLPPERTTADCDVMTTRPDDCWPYVEAAAQVVGKKRGLGDAWLNRECGMFAWQMPLGWQKRCRELGCFDKLRVMVLDRSDLIAAKVMGAPKRPQDRDDLQALHPTSTELNFVDNHLDRVEAETEPGQCDQQRQIVEWLRSE